jgi:Protein of unknown function (DUF1573)
MKKIITVMAVLFSASLAFGQAPAAKPAPAKTGTAAPAPTTKAPAQTTTDLGYKFDKLDHDYGTIQKGSEPYCEFKLTNTSKEPLIISEAHGSCGCTVPEYPKEPIKPGQTVIIKVRYDTNRIGPFDKQVTVTFQGKDAPAILKIHGKVEAPPSETPFPSSGTGTGTNNTGVPVNND